MTWKNFDGSARTLQESIAYLATLRWTDWKPEGITLHNTAAPTLKQWAETGPNHDARIRNLQSYYEGELHWHAGPHWFISRTRINWFSNPLLPGVHSRCWNATRFGIEMVGDFDSEDFNSGDGAQVRDLSLAWVAVLCKRFGFKPSDLTFHRECKLDNHACPGKTVVRTAVIQRVQALVGGVVIPEPPQPLPPVVTKVPPREGVVDVAAGDTLNARAAPNVLGQVVARLVRGEHVTVIGEVQNGDTKWFNIERPHSSTAFVAARYVSAMIPSTPVVARKELFRTTGKMSTFGGPTDTGMTNTEGLALFADEEQMRAHGLGGWLMSPEAAGAPGLGRRLVTSNFYIACRWIKEHYSLLRSGVAYVSANGKMFKARPVDWGPHESTGRVADLSPGLAKALGLETDGTCTVVVYEDGK